jgi:hypothetical protein
VLLAVRIIVGLWTFREINTSVDVISEEEAEGTEDLIGTPQWPFAVAMRQAVKEVTATMME